MHYRLRTLSLTIATLLLSVIFSLLSLDGFKPQAVQGQTIQITNVRAIEAQQLYQEGVRQFNKSQFQEALETFQQVLTIVRANELLSLEGSTLNYIGLAYKFLGKNDKALEFYQQALAIQKQIGDKAGEWITLSKIGFFLETQNQPELAIAFYKQSVNLIEEIRKDLRVLPTEQQSNNSPAPQAAKTSISNSLEVYRTTSRISPKMPFSSIPSFSKTAWK